MASLLLANLKSQKNPKKRAAEDARDKQALALR
jgi:hypothetical protein